VPGQLEGKVVVVTRAGSGIGEACARRIAGGGGRVAVVATLDHAVDGIGVNAVGPAFILTPMAEAAMTAEAIAAVAPMHALGRWGRPEEVAEITAWLLSDAASFATATFYPLDGGLLAR
jgi:NAD(P)-dependent dehydrogenase (short-subunit alcohol dehydrogenase family)